MAEDLQRNEAAYWGAERDEHSPVPVGSERQAPVGDRKSRRPRGLQEGLPPSHRYIGDVRQRCGDAPRAEMGIELLVAHIHEGGRRTDAERASRQAIRPREAKGETLDVTHRSDATEGLRHVDLRSRVPEASAPPREAASDDGRKSSGSAWHAHDPVTIIDHP